MRIGEFSIMGVAALLTASATARAFDPQSGDWHKSDPAYVRVITFNVFHGIGVDASTTPATPTSIGSQHAYIGLICQALQPDVICMQEIYTDHPPKSVAEVQPLVQDWTDTYLGAGVMNVYLSSATDGHIRNVTLSRFPFADLNGDNIATYHDVFVLGPGPDGLPPGTPSGGHIRGWAQTEIDLPDEVYLGDLFVGNSHLKSGGSSTDKEQRLVAGQNIAYWVNQALNIHADPFSPPNPLSALTPVVLCGDMNATDLVGSDSPLPWLRGWTSTPNDGTDRDDSEMLIAPAAEPFTGVTATHNNGSRYDYIIVQDSIATVVEAFVFNSLPAAQNNALPPELAAVLNGFNASSFASDHRAVVVDLDLPRIVPGDLDADGDVDAGDMPPFVDCLTGPVAPTGAGCENADLVDDGHVDLRDYSRLLTLLAP